MIDDIGLTEFKGRPWFIFGNGMMPAREVCAIKRGFAPREPEVPCIDVRTTDGIWLSFTPWVAPEAVTE